MRSIRFLLLVPLVLTSLLCVVAAPIPFPAPNLHQVVHHPDAPHQQTLTGLGHVTHHEVPGKPAHILGSMPVHPNHQGGMTNEQLHDHAHHISTQLGGNHVIHAAHKPGDDTVHFHAIHKDHDDAMIAPDHAIHHPAHDPAHAPHKSLSHGDYGKILVGLDRSAHAGQVQHQYVQRPGHGQGVVGTMPMHQDIREFKDHPELHAHTQWVDGRLGGTQKGNSMVHVTHRDGSPTANFHVTGLHGSHVEPVRPPTPDQPPHQHIAPLAAHEHAGLINHLQQTHQQNQHTYSRITNGGASFKGTIPAHTTGPMTPAHLDEYARHAYDHLKTLPGVDHQNLVLAASHKEGDSHVHVHSAPRGYDMFQRGRGEDQGAYPQFNEALHKAHHVLPSDPTITAHHAELGALKESLQQKGATADPASFNQHIQGHVIGVHGYHRGEEIHQPCQDCHNTLAQFPVDYRGRDRTLPAGIKRGYTG